nr:MAG TPA: hypothetical protein [Caudoviricetes sp.]
MTFDHSKPPLLLEFFLRFSSLRFLLWLNFIPSQ